MTRDIARAFVGLANEWRSAYSGRDDEAALMARRCANDLDDVVEDVFGDIPEIVCLCGSTRFEGAFKREQFRLTVEEQAIVLTVAGDWKDGHDDVWDEIDDEGKEALDELHFRKIDLADRVHVLNVDGYVGSSTINEIGHAIETGTEVSWLEPDNVPERFEKGG